MQAATSCWLGLIAISLALGSCIGASDRMAGPTPPMIRPDTAEALIPALDSLWTPNRMFTEIVPVWMCGDNPCAGASIQPVLVEYAAKHGLRVAEPRSPLPTCQWARTGTNGSRGARLHAFSPRVQKGVLTVTVEAQCGGEPFLSCDIRSYEAAYIDESWQVVRGLTRIVC